MNLQRLLLQVVLVILACTFSAALGYGWGASANSRAWVAKQAAAQARQVQAYQVEVRRGDLATERHLADQRILETRYEDLERTHLDLLKRRPLVVAQRGPAGAGLRACPAAVGGELVAVPQSSPTDAPGRFELPDDSRDGGDPELTLAAVRLWNGSLTGTDAPAGACGAAGAAEGADTACAEGSNLTLSDALANHHTNAKNCAEDRQRYRNLIDYLTRSITPPGR